MISVGLVGCGAIGTQLARTIQRRFRRSARLVAIHDADPKAVLRLRRLLKRNIPSLPPGRLIARCQFVIEAASAAVVPQLVRQALQADRSIMVMSIGGLLQDASWKRLLARSKGMLYVPSGALAGLDGIKAMALGRLTQASLTTRKPPKALAGAPYILKKKLRLDSLKQAKVVFEGSPRQVVRCFPQNTNVAATLALATGLPDRKIKVRVVADPAVSRNSHEVAVSGDCGQIRCRSESVPSSNPKTSELAVRSAIATFKQIVEPLKLGT